MEEIQMTIENVKKTIFHGGYICWADDNRPTLYDDNHKMICYVPMATAERIARENDYVMWHESWGGWYVGRRMGKKYQQHENNRHCEQIAENLFDYVSGLVYRCPECGHEFTAPDCEIYRCPHCENVADLEDYEQLSIYDYLEDCLDIEYRVSSRHELRSVQIMVACGGPNIYIDSGSGRVELYWWGDRADYPLSNDCINALDEWAEEYFNLC
jgi:hypothetical protein